MVRAERHHAPVATPIEKHDQVQPETKPAEPVEQAKPPPAPVPLPPKRAPQQSNPKPKKKSRH
jgi:hypothetical protein